MDSDIVVKGLEDVSRKQRVIYPGILVFLETMQVLLPDVYHNGEDYATTRRTMGILKWIRSRYFPALLLVFSMDLLACNKQGPRF